MAKRQYISKTHTLYFPRSPGASSDEERCDPHLCISVRSLCPNGTSILREGGWTLEDDMQTIERQAGRLTLTGSPMAEGSWGLFCLAEQ